MPPSVIHRVVGLVSRDKSTGRAPSLSLAVGHLSELALKKVLGGTHPAVAQDAARDMEVGTVECLGKQK